MEKIKFTRIQKTAEVISAVLILSLWIYIAAAWPTIPSRLPSHYNGTGMIDAWGGKGILITVPGVCTFLYAMLTLVLFFPKLWNIPVKVTEANRPAIYRCVRNLLCFLKVIMTGMFFYMSVCIAKTQPLAAWLAPVILISLFGTIAYTLTAIIVISKRRPESYEKQ
jgi:uncharacterized membrane protein